MAWRDWRQLSCLLPAEPAFYETIMIIFLSMAGTPPDLAIAGIILTRAILLTGTIIFGYIFYQHALIKIRQADDFPGLVLAIS